MAEQVVHLEGAHELLALVIARPRVARHAEHVLGGVDEAAGGEPRLPSQRVVAGGAIGLARGLETVRELAEGGAGAEGPVVALQNGCDGLEFYPASRFQVSGMIRYQRFLGVLTFCLGEGGDGTPRPEEVIPRGYCLKGVTYRNIWSINFG